MRLGRVKIVHTFDKSLRCSFRSCKRFLKDEKEKGFVRFYNRSKIFIPYPPYPYNKYIYYSQNYLDICRDCFQKKVIDGIEDELKKRDLEKEYRVKVKKKMLKNLK